MQEYNDTRKIEDLDPRVLAEAIEIARKLQANASDGSIIFEDITKLFYYMLKVIFRTT